MSSSLKVKFWHFHPKVSLHHLRYHCNICAFRRLALRVYCKLGTATVTNRLLRLWCCGETQNHSDKSDSCGETRGGRNSVGASGKMSSGSDF